MSTNDGTSDTNNTNTNNPSAGESAQQGKDLSVRCVSALGSYVVASSSIAALSPLLITGLSIWAAWKGSWAAAVICVSLLIYLAWVSGRTVTVVTRASYSSQSSDLASRLMQAVVMSRSGGIDDDEIRH